MIKDTKELKELIEWAINKKVKSLKLNGIEVELSDIAFIEQLTTTEAASLSQEKLDVGQFEEEQQSQDDDETLYWSS